MGAFFCSQSYRAWLPESTKSSILPKASQAISSGITNDPAELAKTTLIQYAMKDNKQRQDAVFIIDGMRYFLISVYQEASG